MGIGTKTIFTSQRTFRTSEMHKCSFEVLTILIYNPIAINEVDTSIVKLNLNVVFETVPIITCTQQITKGLFE